MCVVRLVVLSLATATAIPSISHAALDPAAQECVAAWPRTPPRMALPLWCLRQPEAIP
jgi:hypothetical protein